MYVCKWCGRNFAERRMKGAGGWAVCSESCRQQLSASVNSGDTAKYSRTYKTPYLIAAVLACVAYSTLTKGCEDTVAGEPETTSISAPALEEAAVAEESSAPEPQAATSRTADKPKQALGDFGEPGQFESTTPRTTEPVEPSEPASGENIQMIPAPEPDSAS